MISPRNKKILLFTGAAIMSALIGIYTYFHFNAPTILKNRVVQALHESGFTHVTIDQIITRPNILGLQKIHLDEDGFNTIENLQVGYNLLPLIFNKRIEAIKITGLNLTMSLGNQQIFQTPKDFIHKLNLPSELIFNTGLVDISDSSLAILTQDWGGLNFEMNALLRENLEDGRSLEATIQSRQKQLSANIQLSGNFRKYQGWDIEGTMERARFESEAVQISRANGRIGISGSEKGFFANSEFNIGGFKIGKFAWSDIAATFEQINQSHHWVIAGHALGNDNLEFGLNYTSKAPELINGTIYASSMVDILHYWDNQASIEGMGNSAIGDLKDIFITYSTPLATLFQPQKYIGYSFKKPDQNVDISGTITLNDEEITVQGLMPPTLVHNIPLKDSDIELKEAQMNVALALAPHQEENANKHYIRLNIAQGSLQFGPLVLSNINSAINFQPPEDLKMNKFEKLSFALPFKSGINHSASTSYKLDNNLFLKDTEIMLFDGNIQIAPLTIERYPIDISLDGNNLNLKLLAKALDTAIQANGDMKIAGEVRIFENIIEARNLVFSSQTSGTIQIPENLARHFISDSNIENETAIQALQDFRYEFFEVRVNGNLENNTSIAISTKGANKDILGGRPLTINLTLKDRPFMDFLALLGKA